MDERQDLAGQVALVTGGASGMGRAHVMLLARRGAKVAFTDLHQSGLAALAAELAAEGAAALPLTADNRSCADIRAAVAQTEQAFGRLDILVNNAGISGRSLALENIDEAAFDAMFDTHVKGAFFATQAAVPGMKARRHGRIINISSNFAQIPSSSASHYTGAKSALNGLARAWALELAPWGITVNAVAPGLVDTPMTQASVGAAEIARRAAGFPLGRIALADEVAFAVAWLAGPEAAMVTGQVLSPNGGIAIAGL